jgi:dihydrofolate reductase
MRELKYYVACTVDRFICREDGSLDCFPMQGPHLADQVATFPETIPAHLRQALGVRGGNQWFDTVLMGRKTYQVGLNLNITSPYPHLSQYVFSRSMKQSPDPAVELVSGDAAGFVRKLKQQPGEDIWLCGGGALAAELFSEIDELILKVSPILLGAGIPLFARPVTQTSLDLAESKTYSNGCLLLRYRIQR